MSNIPDEFIAEVENVLPALFPKALRYCKDTQDAHDLVQDTVVKALLNHDKYEIGTNMNAWLSSIMFSTFVNQYRRKKRYSQIIEDVIPYVHPEKEVVDPVLDITIRDRCKYVCTSVLNDILPQYAEVLVLAAAHEKSYKEIASLLDIPIGTVMSRLHRAKIRCRDVLSDNYGVESFSQLLLSNMP